MKTSNTLTLCKLAVSTLALFFVLAVAILAAWHFTRPVSYVPGVVEKSIHGFGPQLTPALAANSTCNRTANGYQPKPEPPQAPAGLKPQELQAWTAFARRQSGEPALVPTFPEHYSTGTEVRSQGMSVSLKPLGSNAASAQIENGKLVYHNAYASTDSLNVASNGKSEEFLLLHDAQAPQKFEYDLSAVTGVKEISLQDNSVHFTNAQGQQLQIEAPYLIENGGRKVADAVQWQLSYPNGPSQPRLALVVNNAGKLRYPVVIDPTWVVTNDNPAPGTWTATGSLNTARAEHTATLLPNGQVLVAGGFGNSPNSFNSAELYNPATGIWTATGSMNTQRLQGHTATLLTNGLVLVAGGWGNSNNSITSAELYNPATGTWTATGSLNARRYYHTATLLTNGQVLVAGGDYYSNGIHALATCELYNPATGTWTTTGSLNAARAYHTAIFLPNGQVLVAGGGGNGVTLTSAELYNPATGTWTATGSPNPAIGGNKATLLPNGQVLVAGGEATSTSSELYNPASGTWTATGSMINARSGHTVSLLTNGQVLVAGGSDNSGNDLTSAELYNPANGTWTATGSMIYARTGHTATLLTNGQVLVAGSDSCVTIAELYNPAVGTPTPSLYFQNGATLGILTLNTNFLPSAWQGVGAMNSGWQERAVGDINGDGTPDIIFQNGTQIGALILNASGAPTAWVGIGAMNAGWQLRGVANITGDGNLDLIFQNGTLIGYLEVNSSGQPVSWTGIGQMGSGWQLRAVASLDGTGHPALIFQYGTQIGALQVNTSGAPTAWTGIGAMNVGWTLSYAVDVTGNGQSELIFQDGTMIGALQLNTSFQPTAWYGIGAMGTGWTLPGDY